MKKIILLLLLVSSSVTYSQNYEKSWEKVIHYEIVGKTKSANRQVESIYKKASLEKNEVQIIKCFFYKSKYLQTLEEDSQFKIIKNLEQEIKKASIPSKAILNLVYANCLKTYINNNSYKFYRRTKLDSNEKGNFLTWTISDFNTQIEILYAESISNESVLNNTPLKKYEEIFDFFNKPIDENKTLYNYLIKENIEYLTSKTYSGNYYRNDKNDLINLLGNNDAFLNQKTDSIKEPIQAKIIDLYKKISSNEEKKTEFERIKFCNDYIIGDRKEYLKALNAFQNRTTDDFLIKKVQLEKVKLLKRDANKQTNPQNYINSTKILDSIISSKELYDFQRIAENEKQEIEQSNITVQFLTKTYENENTRALVYYKNVDSISLVFHKTSFNSLKSLAGFNLDLKASLKNLKPYKIQKYYLKNYKDYYDYSTEIILPKLEIGTYLVEVHSLNADEEKNTSTIQTINVTNNKIFAYRNDQTTFYQVLHRKTGKPIENCKITSKDFELYTNENGIAQFLEPNEINHNRNLNVINGVDSLFVENEHVYNNYKNDKIKPSFSSKIYLDRGIYRPGQKVFFKIVMVQNKGDLNKVLANLAIKIVVKDGKYNDFKVINAVTNEFGSFSGEFYLHKNGVTGDYRIEIEKPDSYKDDTWTLNDKNEHPIWDQCYYDDDYIYFEVEEYKRPKFEVIIEKTKETFSLNKKAFVKGNAKSFSNSSITDGIVKYTVERYDYSYKSKINYNENRKTVASSQTKTNENGNFTIEFDAIVDSNINLENNTIYNYSITVDVTDINGETRSASSIIKIGNQTTILSATIPEKIYTKNTSNITLNSTNMNNEFKSVIGDIKIYYIKPYENKFKLNVLGTPEIKTISDEDFEKYFTYEKRNKEIEKETTSELVYIQKVATIKDKIIDLNFIKNYKSGYYKLTFTAIDDEKIQSEITSNFEIIQSNDSISTGNEMFTVEQLNDDPKKDGFALIKIKCAVTGLYITSEAVFDRNLFYNSKSFLEGYSTILKIPIDKSILDNFKFKVETFFENQYFQKQENIIFKLIETEKLLFETESFRNKLSPGVEETWSFKIKNHQKLNYEILASMYDSSLDVFRKSSWNQLTPNKYYENYFNFKAFTNEHPSTIGYSSKIVEQKNKFGNSKTKLMWFGFDFNNSKDLVVVKEYKKQITKKAKKPLNVKLISGIVSDKYGVMPGANVVVKGTTRGVSTDIDGYYEIEAGQNETLVFSFIGMNDMVKTIKKNHEIINVKLISDSQTLDEVLITGAMGIKKKKETLTSSKQITFAQELTQAANSNISESLIGRVSGLQINTTENGVNPTSRIVLRGNRSPKGENEALIIIDGIVSTSAILQQLPSDSVIDISVIKGAQGAALYGVNGANGVIIVTTKKAFQEITQVKTRTNRNETAFFFPNITSDNHGKFSFKFRTPEELTQWKFQLLAHNKNAEYIYDEKTTVTQKELMVFPNMPRFLRENDTISISAKVSNLSTSKKNGIAILQLFDASTMENIDIKMSNTNSIKNFIINPSGNTVVKWTITIPRGLQGVQYKVIAKSDDYSDGEESIIPVLSNTILMTESLPVWVRENTKKEYTFENLKNNTSSTLQNHQFTLEYMSNPTWIAIQSLPYLMEYEHECAEQTFSRYYANVLASEIINSNPKIANVFENWKKSDKPISKLEQNDELKSLILAETPWLKDTQSEEEKRKNLALLFDIENMKNSQENTFKKLQEKQKSSGGFSWFDNGNENEYITRHIVAGFGHLEKLKVNKQTIDSFDKITKTAIAYLDNKFMDNNKNYEISINKNPYVDLHYLYARSFYLNKFPLTGKNMIIINHHLQSIKSNWTLYSIYNKGLAALVLYRFEYKENAEEIIESLKETSSTNEDFGMYWIENKAGWNWYQAPIETQALLIEAFSEVSDDNKSVDAMKVWLLKNKQTKNWPTTKSTTEAIYALLLKGSNWLSIKDNTIIKIGDEKITSKKLNENEKEAETGYIKMTWKDNEVNKQMASISIENKSKIPCYGAVYWQYFEDLDKIKSNHGSVLSTSKELYLKKNSGKGQELERINSKNPIKVGDLVTVRLIITAKEDMEYIHLKDMRASCFEPINVISEYKWNDGLNYFISTKDAATHFFFDTLNKGTYVIEYDIKVNNSGNFSNGITTIQSMYAPEFTSHTKGIRVETIE